MRIDVCPNVSMITCCDRPFSAAMVASNVPTVWRAQCHVICFSMPAAAVHCSKYLFHVLFVGSLKTFSSFSPRPINAKMSSDNGTVTQLCLLLPVVFC